MTQFIYRLALSGCELAAYGMALYRAQESVFGGWDLHEIFQTLQKELL